VWPLYGALSPDSTSAEPSALPRDLCRLIISIVDEHERNLESAHKIRFARRELGGSELRLAGLTEHVMGFQVLGHHPNTAERDRTARYASLGGEGFPCRPWSSTPHSLTRTVYAGSRPGASLTSRPESRLASDIPGRRLQQSPVSLVVLETIKRYLSRPTLHFCRDQIYFECERAFLTEDGCIPVRAPVSTPSSRKDINCLTDWIGVNVLRCEGRRVVTLYSRHCLAFANDKLPTLSGRSRTLRSIPLPKPMGFPSQATAGSTTVPGLASTELITRRS
jgi:hypothetical protein